MLRKWEEINTFRVNSIVNCLSVIFTLQRRLNGITQNLLRTNKAEHKYAIVLFCSARNGMIMKRIAKKRRHAHAQGVLPRDAKHGLKRVYFIVTK